MSDHWTLTWVAGPDAGGSTVVGRGTHVVGRSPRAAIRCDDPALESHHVLIEVTARGARACQLSGRLPVRLDGVPLDGAVDVSSSATLELGHSLVSVRRGDLTAPAQERAEVATGPGSQIVVRQPRATPQFDPQPVQPPAARSSAADTAGGLLPALLALGGSGLLALLVHQPMFLLFGAIGAVAALGTWGGQRVGVFRRRRAETKQRAAEAARYAGDVARQRQQFIDHHRIHDSTVVSAQRSIERLTSELWSRRGDHADAFVVSIGVGTIAWLPTVADTHTADHVTATSLLPDLSIMADLGSSCRLAVRGEWERAAAIVRAMLLQLAASCGPADVRFVILARQPARWAWLEQVPHANTAGAGRAVVDESDLADVIAELDGTPTVHLVVVTDSPELLTTRTSPLRRAMSGDRSMAVVVLVPAADGIPHVCTSVIDVSGPMLARWHADAALASLPEQVRWAGIGGRRATALAHRLSRLIDPEDPLAATRAIPREVGLVTLLPVIDAAAIADNWREAGTDPPPRTPIGVAADGVVDIDLVRDGPHALLAGTTGAGKSELLRSLVAGLAVACSPDHLNFVLVDYKGGATFDVCAELPHVVGIVTDLDEHLADRALRSLHAELRRREQLLRRVGASDLGSYRRAADAAPLARLVVVVDEFASLVAEQPEFLHALVCVAQRGRSLGVHLILATQRPGGVISDDIRANTNLRVALRLHDPSDSLDVVGDRAAAALPRSVPGRTVVRLGPDELLTFQAARCTGPEADGGTALARVVEAVGAAATFSGCRSSIPPWLAPLPSLLHVDDDAIARGVVGLVDDPDRQRTFPLQWRIGQGHLLLVGATGSDTTSALVLLGCAAIAGGESCHVWAIDGRGDRSLDALLRSPWCGGVVRLHERERLIRLINRLGRDLAKRIADPEAPRQPILVLVNGFELVRASLDELETASEFEALDEIVAIGAAHGITIAAAFDRAAAVPSTVLARCADRWLFHVTDPVDATTLGVAARDVPPARPGRIVITASGLEAQLMLGALPPLDGGHGELPRPVGALPAAVDSSGLPAGAHRNGDLLLPIGYRFDDDRVCVLRVPDGEHVLIIGPARSGRSTALRRVVEAWRQAHLDGWCRVVAPRRNGASFDDVHRSLDEIIADVPQVGPVLIAIDDAELVDDVCGALSELAGSHRHGVLIACAGKPETLRHTYGHWSAVVRRSRLGIVTAAATDLDGDLLGATLPRRLPITARPGLAWVVADGPAVLAQVAADIGSATAHVLA